MKKYGDNNIEAVIATYSECDYSYDNLKRTSEQVFRLILAERE